MAAVRSAVGAPLPFFHLDLDWSRGDWAASSLRLQAYARGHGVRFGIIYNSALASSDTEWLVAAQAHVLTHELDGAGPPDDAVFQSWTDHPDRVLPEAGPNAFTHLIVDYIRARTTLSIEPPAAAGGGLMEVAGFVRTRGGQAIGGAAVDVTATPRDGPYQVLEFRGTHPLAPAAIPVGTATADATGRFSLTSSALEAGRYRLRAACPGDATRWPAWAEASALVP